MSAKGYTNGIHKSIAVEGHVIVNLFNNIAPSLIDVGVLLHQGILLSPIYTALLSIVM